jgi:sarcosine oxidase subunit beta
MAELISTGSTSTLISPFDIRRFTNPSAIEMPLSASLLNTGKLI